jgi:hypothetical protein
MFRFVVGSNILIRFIVCRVRGYPVHGHHVIGRNINLCLCFLVELQFTIAGQMEGRNLQINPLARQLVISVP